MAAKNAGKISILKADFRTSRHKHWKKWVQAVSDIRQRYMDKEYYDYYYEYREDPLALNETASVSILVSAAYMCGGYAIAEYTSTKRQQSDLRKKGRGRDDLYVALEDDYWVFECKQLFKATNKNLETKFDAAYKCSEQTDSIDFKRGVALLIVNINRQSVSDNLHDKYVKNVESFCKKCKKVKFAASLSDSYNLSSCFLIFSDPIKR